MLTLLIIPLIKVGNNIVAEEKSWLEPLRWTPLYVHLKRRAVARATELKGEKKNYLMQAGEV